jgi:copper chaperone CopZ
VAFVVTEERERVTGIAAVAVDVDAGTVTVTSDRALDLTDVRAAIEEAGYELATADRR